MANKFVMSSRQSAELDHAFERNGWEAEDVKWLSQGNNLARFLKVRRGTAKITPAPQPALLTLVGTAVVPRNDGSFVARNHFVVNTKKNAPVKISYLGDNFTSWFLPKEEQPFAGSTLRYGKLSRRSEDGPIIAKLGGEEKAETTLTELHALLQAQKDGGDGPLLTNGYANIFYICDVYSVLRVVRAGWGDGGWEVDAGPVTNPLGWGGESQVFSRDSR